MRELAIKTLCAGLDIVDAVTGKIPFLCTVFGHKWGTAIGSGVGIGHYHCERCGYRETVDNTENYYNAVHEAHRQAGISAPVFTSEYHTAYYETLSN